MIQVDKCAVMKTSPEFYPCWKTEQRIYITDMNQARFVEYKYIIASEDVSFLWDLSHVYRWEEFTGKIRL